MEDGLVPATNGLPATGDNAPLGALMVNAETSKAEVLEPPLAEKTKRDAGSTVTARGLLRSVDAAPAPMSAPDAAVDRIG